MLKWITIKKIVQEKKKQYKMNEITAERRPRYEP